MMRGSAMRASRIASPVILLLSTAVVGRVAGGEVLELAAKDTLTKIRFDAPAQS